MSWSGPPDACVIRITPVAYFNAVSRTTNGMRKRTHHECNNVDPEMFVRHRAEPDACFCEPADHLGIACIDDEFDVESCSARSLRDCTRARSSVTCATQKDKLHRRGPGSIGRVIRQQLCEGTKLGRVIFF
jgi:hypothetical protein